MARIVSSDNCSIFCTSWEVRNPSKKWRKGTRASSVAAWASRAKSMTSCTEPEHSIAKPVERAAITSLWSPKMDRLAVAMARAAMWKTVEVSSPAILNMFGIISSSPWEAVKVVVRAPEVRAPCTEPEAPASDCSSVTEGMVPQMFFRPSAVHWSAHSPIAEEGVMG